MKKYYLIALIIISFVSCSKRETIDSEKKYYDEFYSVLNEIAKDKFPEVLLIVDKTKPVFRNHYGNYPVPKPSEELPPPPPPIGIIYYSYDTFIVLQERKQLDSADADFMLHSIDSTKRFLLDSTRTNLRLVPESKIIEIYRSHKETFMERHQELERLYGSKCFLEVATPIFNSDFTKVLLTLECKGDTTISGPCNKYIYEKKDGKWKQVIGLELFETR